MANSYCITTVCGYYLWLWQRWLDFVLLYLLCSRCQTREKCNILCWLLSLLSYILPLCGVLAHTDASLQLCHQHHLLRICKWSFGWIRHRRQAQTRRWCDGMRLTLLWRLLLATAYLWWHFIQHILTISPNVWLERGNGCIWRPKYMHQYKCNHKTNSTHTCFNQ